MQSTEWHGMKVYSRFSSALHFDEAITIFFKKMLETPKSNLNFYRDRSFQVGVPRLWNSLTDDIRSIQNLLGEAWRYVNG